MVLRVYCATDGGIPTALKPPISRWLDRRKHPTHNLRAYLQNAQLPPLGPPHPEAPPLPPPGEKSELNNLFIRPERRRLLKLVYPMVGNLGKRVAEFMQLIPDLPVPGVDPFDVEFLTVPSSPSFKTNAEALEDAPSPVNIEELDHYWLCKFPLKTLNQIFLILSPKLSTWAYYLPRNEYNDEPEIDHTMFSYRLWQPFQSVSDDNLSGREPTGLVFAMQPPWLLSPADMRSFVEPRFPFSTPWAALRQRKREPRLPPSERLWAKLWDICFDEQCTYFVLTSYDEWVFGCFSDDWTSATISPIFPATCTSPTILQLLLYWTSRGMETSLTNRAFTERERVQHLTRASARPNSVSSSHTDSESTTDEDGELDEDVLEAREVEAALLRTGDQDDELEEEFRSKTLLYFKRGTRTYVSCTAYDVRQWVHRPYDQAMALAEME